MSRRAAAAEALARLPRADLAARPTPLHRGPDLPSGARLLIKRDDLTGLGLGGNKARKLELLCGEALAAGADTLVTVGAAQSNHARMTAAAGAVLGLEVELVLGGEAPAEPAGNQLLAERFGARLHHQDTDDWAELAGALATLAERIEHEGRRPFAIPMGGSTERGAAGYLAAWFELLDQLGGTRPAAIVHASSTGGTHAGLLAGRALWAADGEPAPDVIAIDVAKAPGDLAINAVHLARGALDLAGAQDVAIAAELVEVDGRWAGPAYAEPTAAGDRAIAWAGEHAGLVLDRVYTGKALAGLLGLDEAGRFGPGDTVVFCHTGGHPAVFAPGGSPSVQPHKELV